MTSSRVSQLWSNRVQWTPSNPTTIGINPIREVASFLGVNCIEFIIIKSILGLFEVAWIRNSGVQIRGSSPYWELEAQFCVAIVSELPASRFPHCTYWIYWDTLGTRYQCSTGNDHIPVWSLSEISVWGICFSKKPPSTRLEGGVVVGGVWTGNLWCNLPNQHEFWYG